MNTYATPLPIDHYLVAQTQARATGANSHHVHMLLACYFGLRGLAHEDTLCAAKADAIEMRLRAFCRTGKLLD